MVMLNWTEMTALVAALHAAYPDEDRHNLTAARVEFLVSQLPHFTASPKLPSAQHLDHLRWTWMRLADHAFAALAENVA